MVLHYKPNELGCGAWGKIHGVASPTPIQETVGQWDVVSDTSYFDHFTHVQQLYARVEGMPSTLW